MIGCRSSNGFFRWRSLFISLLSIALSVDPVLRQALHHLMIEVQVHMFSITSTSLQSAIWNHSKVNSTFKWWTSTMSYLETFLLQSDFAILSTCPWKLCHSLCLVLTKHSLKGQMNEWINEWADKFFFQASIRTLQGSNYVLHNSKAHVLFTSQSFPTLCTLIQRTSKSNSLSHDAVSGAVIKGRERLVNNSTQRPKLHPLEVFWPEYVIHYRVVTDGIERIYR